MREYRHSLPGIQTFQFEIREPGYSYQINYPLAKEGEEIVFTIESGQSPKQIAENLEETQIIKSSFWLRYYLKKKDLSSKVIAGNFSLSPLMSISQIAKKITTTNELVNIINRRNSHKLHRILYKSSVHARGQPLYCQAPSISAKR